MRLALSIAGLVLFTRIASACQCVAPLTICSTVNATGLVFVGTVESLEPAFLSRWDRTGATNVPLFNQAYAEAHDHPSPASLSRVKDALLRVVPNMSKDERSKLDAAKTVGEAVSVFNAQVFQGVHARLRVRTLFKHEDDDDDPPSKGNAQPAKDDDDDKKPAPTKAGGSAPQTPNKPPRPPEDEFEIFTSSGDCGVDFQVGETYLVYADEDEGTSQLYSDRCSRTRRLSDAGEDLAYLFFYKDDRKKSSRLEGFASADHTLTLDFGQLPEAVNSPAAGLIIDLHATGTTRFTESDAAGHFVFDGLPGGDYQLSAFPRGYAPSQQPIAGPYTLHIKENDCARQLIFAPARK